MMIHSTVKSATSSQWKTAWMLLLVAFVAPAGDGVALAKFGGAEVRAALRADAEGGAGPGATKVLLEPAQQRVVVELLGGAAFLDLGESELIEQMTQRGAVEALVVTIDIEAASIDGADDILDLELFLVDLDDDGYERAAKLIPNLEGRMRRDGWNDQARELHLEKYNEAI